jgi:F0F1-type ATP synthase membrane subunit b/b'
MIGLLYLVLAQMAVFAIMVMAMRRFLLRDTMKAVNKLRDVESELGKKEDTIRKRIEETESEFRRKAAESQDTLAHAKEDLEKELARTRETLVEEAKRDRDRIMDEATRSKERMRLELAREMESKTLDNTGRICEMAFSDEMGRRVDQAFIDELLAALEEMDSSSITLAAEAVEVDSSHPMPQATKDRIRDLVSRKFGATLDVHETVHPELMAGIRMKLGSLEIDGSLQNRFREAVDQIKKEYA